MLPALNAAGNLPPGIHRATLDEVVARFGVGSSEREVEAKELAAFVDWARNAGIKRLIVDGSFVTGKESPNDVDVAILPGRSQPEHSLAAQAMTELSWPFVHIMVAVDDADLERWALEDFGTDKENVLRGVVEVEL